MWEPWAALGGALASGPRLDGVNAGSNLLEVYARGADKALWRKRQQANVTVDDVGRRMGVRWGHWESLGGVFASGVSTATTADLLPQVFARAPTARSGRRSGCTAPAPATRRGRRGSRSTAR